MTIKKIEAGIRAIRLGTKSPKEAQIGGALNKLKEVNEGMHEDLIKAYKNVIEDYKKKNPDYIAE